MNIDRLNINSYDDIYELNNNDYSAPLYINGSVIINKGLKIGFSESSIPGNIIFDGLNFYGFNKNGWTLLSNNDEYVEIESNYENNNLYLNINIEDDINYKYNINENIDKLYINLTKDKFFKINSINIFLTNNIKKKIMILFNDNNNNIYYSFNKHDIYIDNNIIKINIQILDDNYLISFKKFN